MKKNIYRINCLGILIPFGYSKYIQKVEKDKDKYYNRVEIDNVILPEGCGTKINIVV